ncbi:MAG TPA: BatA domain-containing protein [Phycisphaerae bacterium]|nr:BatA domain-containing protein [Phycisphaerae bacterium]
MPFIHPVIFWTGLGAVSVPILIHLLNRRRFRVKDWAAMKFLLESIRKNRRRLRIEELILLALRCLLILILAMAVARFTGCAPSVQRGAGEEGSQTSVFILDDSYSMGQKVGVGTLFSTATADLAQELQGIPTTHQVAVLPGALAKRREAWFSRNFLTDAKSLASRVRALEPSDWRMDMGEALAVARETFQGVEGPKKLYVLGDFRRVDLTGDERINAIRKEFAELRRANVEVIALDYGRPARNNLTIQDMTLLDKFVLAKAPLRIRVAVRNNGTTTASEVELRLSAKMNTPQGPQGVSLPVQVVGDIDAGQVATKEIQVTCSHPGPAVITASLPPDELVADNTAHLALDVREHVRVLVVDGQPSQSAPEDSESFYFKLAIDPKEDGSYGARPDVVSEDGLVGLTFDEYDLVALLNVSRFPEEVIAASRPGRSASQPTTAPRHGFAQLSALERYVQAGGGLVVFMGDHVDLNFYNDYLWAQGAGLMPFRIGAPKGKAVVTGEFVQLDPKTIAADSFLRTFRDEGAAFTSFVKFFRFTSVQELSATASGEAGAPRVLARFNDPGKSPAVAGRRFGKGTVLVFYSTADNVWTDWPTDIVGTYATVMLDTLAYLARSQKPRTEPVGLPIVFQLPKDWRDATAMLRTPKYPQAEEVLLVRPPEDRLGVLRYEGPTSAGVYTLRLSKPATEEMQTFMARNVDPAEGDLAPAGEGVLTAAFGSEDFLYRQVQAGGALGEVQARAKKEYWIYAIAALLALLGLEVFLGQRFGHYTASAQGTQR